MNFYRKKIQFSIVLIFLFALFFNNGGNIFLFYSLKYNIQSEIHEKIFHDKSIKELIKFENIEFQKNFQWLRYGKEFSYKNKMYDIVRIENNKNSKILVCINDKMEKELTDNFVSKSVLGRSITKLLKIFNFYFFQQANKVQFINVISYNNFITLSFDAISSFLEIDSPPPKFLN